MQQVHIDDTNSAITHILEPCSGPDSIAFSIKTLIYCALLSLGCILVLNSYFPINIIGYVLIGAMYAHGVELTHQALHGTGFKSQSSNRIVGFLMAMPMLISFRSYQLCHLRHHAFIGTRDDTEFFEFNILDKNAGILRRIASFTMISHYYEFIVRVAKSFAGKTLYDFLSEEHNRQCRTEYITIFTVLLIALIVSIIAGSSILIHLWLIPLVFVAGPLHTVIEFPEHFGCDQSTKCLYANTRSIKSNVLVTWFVNGNNYHVEHHQYPILRPEHAFLVHSLISTKILNKNESYMDFVKYLKAKVGK